MLVDLQGIPSRSPNISVEKPTNNKGLRYFLKNRVELLPVDALDSKVPCAEQSKCSHETYSTYLADRQICD
jgi:hypothetical protein